MADREHPSDQDLLGRIASGDREAFAALYRRRRPDVFRFALHMSGSHAAAEDVVQDVFVAIIEQAARYDPSRAAVVPWLLGIARNHVRRYQAKAWSHMGGEEWSHMGGARTEAIDADPLAAIAQRQDVAAMRRLIAELPIRYREVIVLCDLRELSYEDAASVLRCPVGTVRSRLHRGRMLLASRLRGGESLLRTPANGLVV